VFKLCYNCDTDLHQNKNAYHFREVLNYKEIFNPTNVQKFNTYNFNNQENIKEST